ncbi:MAG: Ig-like domain-containing protein [Actinomycetota bacterium]
MRRYFSLTLAAVRAITALSPGGRVSAQTEWTSKVDATVLEAAASGPTEFIVYMQAKADLGPAASLSTKEAKGAFVYEALSSTASTSQAGLVTQLQGLGASFQRFWIGNAVVTGGDSALLQAVASRTDVKFVYPLGKGRFDPPVDSTAAAELATTAEPSLVHVNADDAWALGYKGQGVVVAGADTGVRYTHQAIKRQYRGYDAATNTWDHDYNWHDAIHVPNTVGACPESSPEPCDDNQHGTHTVGTIVGDDGAGNQVGVAPEAKWIACRNMVEGFGVVPTYMECMQWLMAPTDSSGANPDPSKAPDVVNNSWGCVEGCASPLLKDMVDASRAAGIFYAVSAGNEGRAGACATIAVPLAVYDSSFTVGATNATNDNISSFSSRGPVLTNAVEGVAMQKPDIVAPGVGIRSATNASDSSYAALSGTSMSGPHVAGVVALILSANPALRGHVDDIEGVIRGSAVPLPATDLCGQVSPQRVPNYTFGWGRIDALAAVNLALETQPTANQYVGGEILDQAHNAPIPCELLSGPGGVPRSAKNLVHIANVCGIVGTDIEFQSRTDASGVVHDYAFVGTMGAGARIFDITDPRLPRYVGGYADPGWQGDVSVRGDLLTIGYDPILVAAHGSDCLRTANATTGQTRGGADIIRLAFDPALAALKAPLTFQTHRLGCYLNTVSGGAHTLTLHPSGEWLAVNTSSSGIEVVDLRNGDFSFVRKIPSSVAASAHDVFFSADGNTLYSAGVGSTRLVDVRDIFTREPTLISIVPNSPSAEQGADGHVVAISHQSDVTSDGRMLIVTDEKGGGLNNTSCNTSPTGAIGGAHFWALREITGIDKSAGATIEAPKKVGTWIYPNPTLALDALDPVLASLGRTERACTIHVFRAGGNGSASPGAIHPSYDGVSTLPANEMVAAHYGAGVWHIDTASAPGELDDNRTTWGRTLGWNVMPGAETWSAKEYKGYIYAGDMGRGFDVYRFGACDGVGCVDPLASPAPSPSPSGTPTPTPTPTATPTPTPSPTATPSPTPTPPFCPTEDELHQFESGSAGWSHEVAGNATGSTLSPEWRLVTDLNAKSASSSWNSDAKTLDLKDDRLIGPPVDLSSVSRVSFWHRFGFEEDFDGGVLEVSTDGGRTWTDVEAAGGVFLQGGYNGTIDTGFESPIAGRRAWTGGDATEVSGAMTLVVVDVSALAPAQNAIFRWRLAGDPLAIGALPGTGWWIDDVTFSGLATDCNEPPVANDDAAVTQEDSPVTLAVLANDTDPDGDTLFVRSFSDPANGSVIDNPDGTITYSPDAGFVGTDTFTYTASDGEFDDTATVTITVEARPNTAPVANGDSATTARNTAVTIAVLANDFDADGDALTLAGVTQPSSGTATANADGTVTYTPATNASGSFTFTYSIEDGHGGTATGTVTVNVGEPGAPLACFSYKPKEPKAGQQIGFDARCSADDSTPDSGLLYQWDFESDGVIDATGIRTTHTYDTAGTYTATLSVTDSQGNTDVLRRDVVVKPK